MDIYSLINSKAISEYCRKIDYQFRMVDIAGLICRNRSLDINEKIKLYNELIENYKDMIVTETWDYKHYDSVKTLIKNEIERLKTLKEELEHDGDVAIYVDDDKNKFKSYNTILIKNTVNEVADEEFLRFTIYKKYYLADNGFHNDFYRVITAYFFVNNKEIKLVDIYDSNSNSEIDNICIDIPTPFKKGDLLVKYWRDCNSEDCFPFVLNSLCTGNKDLLKKLDEEDFDSYGIYELGPRLCSKF